MKRNFLAVLLLCATFVCLSSCKNGLYDADPKTTNTGGNPLNPGGGSNGGTAADFPWSGVDPMSAKIDGTLEIFDQVIVATLDSTLVLGGLNSNVPEHDMIIMVPVSVAPGVYTMGSNYHATYSTSDLDAFGITAPGAIPGKIYIETNSATHIKGKFYFTGGNPLAPITTKTVTEGYFNVTK